ncbi:hypothetical protein SNEBB_004442 [Seison nebaliae]|nr:hypothetical protein SNEBB_004442 [Seison nebaliae]
MSLNCISENSSTAAHLPTATHLPVSNLTASSKRPAVRSYGCVSNELSFNIFTMTSTEANDELRDRSPISSYSQGDIHS